jgi:hypothetical protein
MAPHPDDNLILSGASFSIGTLFLIFATITAFDIYYLFFATLPFIVLGQALLSESYWWSQTAQVDSKSLATINDMVTADRYYPLRSATS